MLVGLFVLAPIWVLVLMATDGSIVGYPSGFHPLPVQPTLDRFAEALQRPFHPLDFWGLLRNSLIVAGAAAGASLVFGATAAYAFARLRFPGRDAGLGAILVGAFLPPIALAVPLYILFISLERAFPFLDAWGLHDSILALADPVRGVRLPALRVAHAGRVPGRARRISRRPRSSTARPGSRPSGRSRSRSRRRRSSSPR